MGRQIFVKALMKKEPQVRLYVLALLALARQLQEQEADQAAGSTQPATDNSEGADDGSR
jgi:hypothetical protein